MRGLGLLRVVWLSALLLGLAASTVRAEPFGTVSFQRAWARLDQPVAAGKVQRTWIWGPEPFTATIVEPYAEGTTLAGGKGSRLVQYLDKARLEITDPTSDPTGLSSVSNGLLVRELVTGRMQLGDNRFAEFAPAEITVAGDPDDREAPTYASFRRLMAFQPIPAGWRITQTLDRAGNVGDDPSLAVHNVTAAVRASQTNHNVASVFWAFMTSSGTIYENGQYGRGQLFRDPYAVTGLPLTEAYWVTAKLGGKPRRMLVQAFERRVLTFAPDNAEDWKVESGNVGRHYYAWRYGGSEGVRLDAANIWSERDADGRWVFLGEVRNETRAAHDQVRVTITLYDRAKMRLASASGYVDASVIGPGERLPFRVWFDTGPDYDHFAVEVTGSPSARLGRPGLTVTVGRAQPMLGGSYRVTNTVRNDSGQPIDRPTYVVVLYDGAGRVVDYISGFVIMSTLQPGASANVEVTFFDPPDRFSHYTAIYSD